MYILYVVYLWKNIHTQAVQNYLFILLDHINKYFNTTSYYFLFYFFVMTCHKTPLQ